MSATSAQANAQSTAEKFYRYFQSEVVALQEQVGRLEDHGISGGERTDAIEHCSAGIARLTAEVREIIDSLPAHDRQSYTDSLKALSTKFQTAKSQLSRKQKFSFKNSAFKVQKNASAISLHDAAELAQQRRMTDPLNDGHDLSNTSSFATTPLRLQTPDLKATENNSVPESGGHKTAGVVVDITNKAIVNISEQAPLGVIARVEHSIVDLSRTSTTLRTLSLKDVSQSIIICPIVSGPIHLTNISRSIIVAACHQFRMHDSSACDVYLHCTSRPIIEACAKIRFAPLPDNLDVAARVQGTNLWNNVDDFKWLRSDPSPNWSILPADEQLSEGSWSRLAAVEDGSIPDTTFQEIGIPQGEATSTLT